MYDKEKIGIIPYTVTIYASGIDPIITRIFIQCIRKIEIHVYDNINQEVLESETDVEAFLTEAYNELKEVAEEEGAEIPLSLTEGVYNGES